MDVLAQLRDIREAEGRLELQQQQQNKRRVVCAAVYYYESGYVILGPRHFDQTMHTQITNMRINPKDKNAQGFIDQHGVFMDRKEALEVAINANQLIRPVFSDVLYSENLY